MTEGRTAAAAGALLAGPVLSALALAGCGAPSVPGSAAAPEPAPPVAAAPPSAPAPAEAVAPPDGRGARERFYDELQRAYDYLPADVAPEVRKAKVPELEAFFRLVESDPTTYLPLLREALRARDTNAYFLYDGSVLLAGLARGSDDVQLACDATARCRLVDVGRKGYFHHCHFLAGEGGDPTAAVLKILEDPAFRFFLTRHAYWMKQADCLRLCLLRLREETWVPRAAARLAAESDATAAATLLHLLAESVTPGGDAAVARFRDDETRPAPLRQLARYLAATADLAAPEVAPQWSREEFEEFLGRAREAGRLPSSARDGIPDTMRWEAVLLVRPAGEALLRELRRKTAARVSDEALLDLSFLTALLRRIAVASGK